MIENRIYTEPYGIFLGDSEAFASPPHTRHSEHDKGKQNGSRSNYTYGRQKSK